MGSWHETKLWKLIQARTPDDHHVRHVIRTYFPVIESVLQSGGTSSLDFTLHDHAHAFRVAEKIALLGSVQDQEGFSLYELALLLFSAYLHDIGMTPARDVAQRHYRYICTGAPNLLDAQEISKLQSWLDEEHEGIEVPVDKGPLSVSGLNRSEEIFAYYCRHRHNDWSETWIRENLAEGASLYPAWLDDLVTLCRSHHDGLQQLRGELFNARHCGPDAQVLNLRYLAALLRLADVLEFDPERTPDSILRHRAIAPRSKVYWHKDKEIALRVSPDSGELTFVARTPDAQIHRAVLDTAAQVDAELLCCSTLKHEGAFLRGVIPTGSRAYPWPWSAKLTMDVAPKNNEFVYIDGAFRPDQHKILKLLAGTELYGDPMAAVRELIQNAVDAVREQIACEKLEQPDPADPDLDKQLARLHRIHISVEQDSEGVWLLCSDDGVGMTRNIIERHLLVSGSQVRAEVRALEREAKTKGFATGRTGQFGIGVLSYFMIGDKLVLSTRRSSNAWGELDSHGWNFSIGGVTSFGQLTASNRGVKGTEVRIRLKPEVVEDGIAKWAESLVRYLEATVAHLPCRLEVRTPNGVRSFGPYWALPVESLRKRILSSVTPPTNYLEHRLRTAQEAQRIERSTREFTEFYALLEKSLSIFETVEGDLPGGLGRYRATMPYFDVGGHALLKPLNMAGVFSSHFDSLNDFYQTSWEARESWKGFALESGSHRMRGSQLESKLVVFEIDWTAGGRIAIDRRNAEIEAEHRFFVFDFLQSLENQILARFLERNRDSKFRLLNEAASQKSDPNLTGGKKITAQDFAPIFKPGKAKKEWDAVAFPLVDAMSEYFPRAFLKGSTWRGQPVTYIGRLSGDYSHNSLDISSDLYFSQIVFSRAREQVVVFSLWDGVREETKLGPSFSGFPEEWEELLAITSRESMILNSNNPLVRYVSSRTTVELPPEPEPIDQNFLDKLLESPTATLAWILSNAGENARYWESIRDNFEASYDSIFEVLERETGLRSLYIWTATFMEQELLLVSKASVKADVVSPSADCLKFADGFSVTFPSEEDWWLVNQTL